MKQNFGKTAVFCNILLDLIINTGAVYLAILFLDREMVVFNQNTLIISLIAVAGSILVYFACDMYSLAIFEKLHKTISRLACVQLFLVCAMLLVIILLAPNRTEFYELLFISAVLSFSALAIKKILSVKISHSIRKSQKHRKTVLIVGNGSGALEYEKQIKDNPHYGYSVEGYICDGGEELNILGNYNELESILSRLNPYEVVIALPTDKEHMIQGIVDACNKAGVRTSIVPHIYKYFKSKCQVDMVGGLPVINTRDIPLDNPANAAMKRLMDIIISLIVIVITSPIMLVAAIGVKFSSKGPVIFKQERVGKNNKKFTMYKFRSMRVNEQEQTAWTTPNDRRKTRFGTFMRKTGIDELPQFFNVLFGSMSIVGPRPELPTFVEEYSKSIPLYKVKHQVKPGITGLAQIYGFRGDTSIEGRIEMDIKYIENWSLFNDIKILVLTPLKMFNRSEKYVK